MKTIELIEQIKKEIEARFGFLPPFFSPALKDVDMLALLWRETRAAYLDNPLPEFFKEKVFAHLSRYSSSPYCLVCHSSNLKSLKVKGEEILHCVENPVPTVETEIRQTLSMLHRVTGPIANWPESGSYLDDCLFRLTVWTFLKIGSTEEIRGEMRRLLSPPGYAHWTSFLSYVKMCHAWTEAYPEISYETDKRVQDHLASLIQEESRLEPFFRNYSERVRREFQIREEQRMAEEAEKDRLRLAAIIDFSEDAICGITREGLINSWNPAAERMFKYSLEEVRDQSFSNLMPPELSDEMPRVLEKIWKGERVEHYETVRLRKDGGRVDISLTISPVKNYIGEIVGASMIARDITERKRAEASLKKAHDELEFRVQERTKELLIANEELQEKISELKQAKDELGRKARDLERSNAELEEFASVVSHDLKEPLQRVIVFAEYLQMNTTHLLGAREKDYFARIRNAAFRMNELIEGLLRLSSVGKKQEDFEAIDLAKVIDEVRVDLELRIKEIKAKIEIGILPGVRADKLQMHELFVNLISNALKFRQENEMPHVTIEGQNLGDGWVQITVSDNGIGFEEKDLDRIFKPFVRLHSSENFDGSGMGLAICHKIITRHGGKITAKSEPGKGAAFIFTLPIG